MSSKRQKVDEYFAKAGFDLFSLDSIPFDSLALGLSSLSNKDLLDLHGKSKDIKNRRLRAAAQEAIRIKLVNMIGYDKSIQKILNGYYSHFVQHFHLQTFLLQVRM